jgi:hypothetical protein
MNISEIQQELDNISLRPFARKTDKQLIAYEELSNFYKSKYQGKQPSMLLKYNLPINRKCKLSIEQVREIRSKYVPNVYGKKKLGMEYGVSTSVIYRILNRVSWKE